MNATERRRLTRARIKRERPPMIIGPIDIDPTALMALPGSITFHPADNLPRGHKVALRMPNRYLVRSR